MGCGSSSDQVTPDPVKRISSKQNEQEQEKQQKKVFKKKLNVEEDAIIADKFEQIQMDDIEQSDINQQLIRNLRKERELQPNELLGEIAKQVAGKGKTERTKRMKKKQ